MLRLFVATSAFLLLGQVPAEACRAPPPVSRTIVFPTVPRDVSPDKVVLQVTFTSVNVFNDRRRIGRARVDRVVQGALIARNVYIERMPSSAACQTDVQLGQRGYVIGRVVPFEGNRVGFVPEYTEVPHRYY
jgi:hypothetical protein